MARARVRILVGIMVAFVVLAVPTASSAITMGPMTTGSQSVADRWIGLIPCIITAYKPSTGYTKCTGSTTWIGTWTGVTHYVFQGKLDPVTFAGHGTLRERFFGKDDQGRVGTMRFSETLDSVATRIPGTAAIRIEARIVGATGGFAGAEGSVVFTGLANAASAFGTFTGSWVPPPR